MRWLALPPGGIAWAALELLGAERFDAVVTDFDLAQASGLEVLHEAMQRCPETARILITGSFVVAGIDGALGSGLVQRLLPKPWTKSELIDAVRDLAMASARASGA